MPRRDRIVIIHSRRDVKWSERLETHLKPRLRNIQVVPWSDKHILPGAPWKEEIAEALTSAAVAVVLVTPDCLASDFIMSHELPELIRAADSDELTLLWIAVKASAHDETPLTRFQALNSPTKPLAMVHTAHVPRELDRMALQIKEAWLKRCDPEVVPGPTEPPQARVDAPVHRIPRPTTMPANTSPPDDVAIRVLLRRRTHAVLGGWIVDFACHVNPATGRWLVIAKRSPTSGGRAETVHVLEQIGDTIRQLWSPDEFDGITMPAFELEDIDQDGVPEILFVEDLGGKMVWWRRLSIYWPARRLLVRLDETWERGPDGPQAMQIALDPESLDEHVRRSLEAAALKRGFLKGLDDFDLDSPTYAVQRWHIENGTLETGVARIHLYRGSPPVLNSVSVHIRADGIDWIGEFKGALWAHIAAKNQFFVVYSSPDIYNWAKCLVFHDGILWFACHMENAVRSFEVASNRLRLHKLDQARYDVDVLGVSSDGDWLLLQFGEEEEAQRIKIADLLRTVSDEKVPWDPSST